MAKKPKPRNVRRLTAIDRLEAAHKRFKRLADAQPRGEVKNALHEAAVMASTLEMAVGAVQEIKLFLDIVMREGRR